MNNHLWWLEDFESKISSKKVRRRAELYGYFYARKVFGLDSIMSDKDQNHLLDELQIARAEIDRLRELLRWRDAKTEKPKEPTSCLVILGENQYMDVTNYHGEGDWSTGIITYWRPIGPLPGGE